MSKDSAPPPDHKLDVQPMGIHVEAAKEAVTVASTVAAADAVQGGSSPTDGQRDSKSILKQGTVTVTSDVMSPEGKKVTSDVMSPESKKLGFQVADDKPPDGKKVETAADDDDEDVPLPPSRFSKFRRKDSIAVTKLRMLKQLEEGQDKSEDDDNENIIEDDSGHKHPMFRPPTVIDIVDSAADVTSGCFKPPSEVEQLLVVGPGEPITEPVIELPQAPDDLSDVVVVDLAISFEPEVLSNEPLVPSDSTKPPNETAGGSQQSSETLRAELRREVEQVIERRLEREQLEGLQRDILRRQFEQELQKEYQRAIERDIQQEFTQPLPPGFVLIMSGDASEESASTQPTQPQTESAKDTPKTEAQPAEKPSTAQPGTTDGPGQPTSSRKQASLIMLIPSQPILDRPPQSSTEPEFPALLPHEPQASTSAAILILQFGDQGRRSETAQGSSREAPPEPSTKKDSADSSKAPPESAQKMGTEAAPQVASEGTLSSKGPSAEASNAPGSQPAKVPSKETPKEQPKETPKEQPKEAAPSEAGGAKDAEQKPPPQNPPP